MEGLILLACLAALASCFAAMARSHRPSLKRPTAMELPLRVTTYNPTPFVKLGPYSGKDRRL